MSKSKKISTAIQAMGHGLMVVVVHPAHYMPMVRRVIERQALRGASDTGIVMPDALPLTSLYSTEAELAEGRSIAAHTHQRSMQSGQKFESLGLRRAASLFRGEGLALIAPLIEAAQEGWFSIAQHDAYPSGASVGIALDRLRELSDRHSMRTMLFLNGAALPPDLDLTEYCDLLVEARACDPDPGCDGAFSLLCPAYRALWRLGSGAALCSFCVSDGYYRFRSGPFISEDVVDRYIWMLYCSGTTMEKIGLKVGLSRSAVSRRLVKLPGKRKLDLADGWERAYQEHLGDHHPNKASTTSDADFEVDDTDTDADDHEEEEDQ